MKYITGFRVFQAIVLIAITSACIVGFFVVGPPSEERARRMDMQRINDLQQITYAVDQFYNQTNFQRLPETLTELRTTQNIYVNSIKDPKTTTPYGYHSVDTLTYELCATFETAIGSSNGDVSKTTEAVPYYVNNSAGNAFWDHQPGDKCYTLKVNVMPQPAVMKPVSNIVPIQDPAPAINPVQ